jgi:hypothetical protein
MMIPIDDDHCKCPVCGTEVWYNYNEEISTDEIAELMQDSLARHNTFPEYTVLGGSAVPGGGSKSKSRSKKQLMKKPSTSELYNKLSGSKTPKPRRKKKDIDTVI